MRNTDLRLRAKSKLLRVIFPDGRVICHNNVTSTMVETLRLIGEDKFGLITLEISKLPILSQVIYPRFKKYMKHVSGGWYLNTQSNTDNKYMQLRSINDSLHLGLQIELGTDFEIVESAKPDVLTIAQPTRRKKERMCVTFADGESLAYHNALDTLLETIRRLGIERITRKDIQWCGRPIITTHKVTNNQIQIAERRWLVVPTTTKEKIRLLRIICATLGEKLDISLGIPSISHSEETGSHKSEVPDTPSEGDLSTIGINPEVALPLHNANDVHNATHTPIRRSKNRSNKDCPYHPTLPFDIM